MVKCLFQCTKVTKPKGVISLGIVFIILGFLTSISNNGTTWWWNNAFTFILGFWILGSVLLVLGISLKIKNAIQEKRNPTPKKFQELNSTEKDEKIEEIEKKLEKIEDEKNRRDRKEDSRNA